LGVNGISNRFAGWFFFVILSVITLGEFKMLANIFGKIMLFGLPAGIIWEIIKRIKKHKKHHGGKY